MAIYIDICIKKLYIYSIGITYVTHELGGVLSRILTQPHAVLTVPHTYSHEIPGRKNTKAGESVSKCTKV